MPSVPLDTVTVPTPPTDEPIRASGAVAAPPFTVRLPAS